MKRLMAALLVAGCVAWVGFVVHVHIEAISVAYGDGPPYYARSVNMDKWASPWPALAGLDALTAGVLLLAGWLARRLIRAGR